MSPMDDRAKDAADRAERAYRRGFEHAAVEALSAVRRGATADDLEGWAKVVGEWRTDAPLAFVPAPQVSNVSTPAETAPDRDRRVRREALLAGAKALEEAMANYWGPEPWAVIEPVGALRDMAAETDAELHDDGAPL